MSFQLGQTVGSYEFLDVLGTSNRDVAFKVRNHLSQRLEALRVLSADSVDDPKGSERFLREIKVHASLLHPNVVTFYHAAELDGQLVMTTELVEGITLSERLQSVGPLHWREAVSHISQVLQALGYAHALGIIHRNVTPETIILTADTTVKLTGFGLAKAVASPNLTQSGSVLGALKYIPPEQIRGLETLDARGDLYSVGVVLYEALTGQLPFDSHSQFQVMLDHVAADPALPSAANSQVPREFDEILLTALAKDPADRFQSADQFLARLEGVKNTLRGKAIAPAAGTTVEHSSHSAPESPVAVPEPAKVEAAPAEAEHSNDPVPGFCAVAYSKPARRNLIILGVSSLVIGMAVAVILTVAKL